MSDKNLNTENKIKKPSLLWKIKAQYTIMNIFDLISNYKRPQFIHDMLKCQKEPSLKKTALDMKLRNRINQLGDFRNWFYYLKYIYLALEVAAKDFYNNRHSDIVTPDEGYEYTYEEYYSPNLKEFEKQNVEIISYIMLFEVVYLAKNKKLFNEYNLQIKPLNENKKATSYKTIFSVIEDILKNSYKNDKLYMRFVEQIAYWNVKSGLGICFYDIKNYLIERFPNYQNDEDLKYDLCFLVLKIMWLKNNTCDNRTGIADFNKDILNVLELPNLGGKLFDYDKLIKHLQKNCDLYSFVCGQYDFDIRSYCNKNLQIAIKNALPTQKQKDEFQKFIEGENKSKKDIKKEEPIPNLEKQNLKDI